MKYIEELKFGDTFKHGQSYFVLSCDKKSNGDSFCLNIQTGMPAWFAASTIVEQTPIFTVDENNHFIAIKETKKDDIP